MQIKIRESPWNIWIFGEVDRTFKKEKYLDRHDCHLHLEFGEGRTTLDCLRGRLGRDHDVIGERSMVATWLRDWEQIWIAWEEDWEDIITSLEEEAWFPIDFWIGEWLWIAFGGRLGRDHHVIWGRCTTASWF